MADWREILLRLSAVQQNISQDKAKEVLLDLKAYAEKILYEGEKDSVSTITDSFPSQGIECDSRKPSPNPIEKFADAMVETDLQDHEQNMANQVDLAFLFSSPLVVPQIDGSLLPIDSLDQSQELELIANTLVETNRSGHLLARPATTENLRFVIDSGCIGLHFSGHGVLASKADQEYLIFEDTQGAAHFVGAAAVHRLLTAGRDASHDEHASKESQSRLSFVFVASCHSLRVGQVFLHAGVQHVVCVKREDRVMDKSTAVFAKAFYHALFANNADSVTAAFHIAQARVSSTAGIPAEESDKFVLLKNVSARSTHPFSHVGYGHWNICQYSLGEIHHLYSRSKRGLEKSYSSYAPLPAIDECFIGRNVCMYEIVKILSTRRLVTIRGPPGIGKTSLAKSIARFFSDRGTFSNGVAFISLRGCHTSESLLAALYRGLHYDSLPSLPIPDNESETQTEEQMWFLIKDILFHKSALIVLDNTEDPLNCIPKCFRSCIQAILDSGSRLSILLTSRQAIGGGIAGVSEKVYTLEPLQPVDAALLFEKLAPRPLLLSEISGIGNFECNAESDQSSLFMKKALNQLSQHPVLQFLGGHPQAIALAAPLLQDRSLNQVQESLLSRGVHELQVVDTPQDQRCAVNTLIVSLDVSIQYLSTRCTDIIPFFCLLGLLPAGAFEYDFDGIWGNSWKDLVGMLTRASLLVEKQTTCNQSLAKFLIPFRKSSKTSSNTTFAPLNRLAKDKSPNSTNSTNSSVPSIITHYSTFPFITDYARTLFQRHAPDKLPLSQYPDKQSGLNSYQDTTHNKSTHFGINTNSGTIASVQEQPYLFPYTIEASIDSAMLSARCVIYLARVIDNVHKVIGTASEQALGAHMLLEAQEANFWACLQRETSARSRSGVAIKNKVENSDICSPIAHLACCFSQVLLLLGRTRDGIQASEMGLEAINILEDKLGEANLHKALGVLNTHARKYERAKKHLSRALLLYEHLDSLHGIAVTSHAVGHLYILRGNHRSAHNHFSRSLLLFTKLNHFMGQNITSRWLGNLCRKLPGMREEAQQHFLFLRKLRRKSTQDHKGSASMNSFIARWIGDCVSLQLEIPQADAKRRQKMVSDASVIASLPIQRDSRLGGMRSDAESISQAKSSLRRRIKYDEQRRQRRIQQSTSNADQEDKEKFVKKKMEHNDASPSLQDQSQDKSKFLEINAQKENSNENSSMGTNLALKQSGIGKLSTLKSTQMDKNSVNSSRHSDTSLSKIPKPQNENLHGFTRIKRRDKKVSAVSQSLDTFDKNALSINKYSKSQPWNGNPTSNISTLHKSTVSSLNRSRDRVQNRRPASATAQLSNQKIHNGENQASVIDLPLTCTKSCLPTTISHNANTEAIHGIKPNNEFSRLSFDSSTKNIQEKKRVNAAMTPTRYEITQKRTPQSSQRNGLKKFLSSDSLLDSNALDTACEENAPIFESEENKFINSPKLTRSKSDEILNYPTESIWEKEVHHTDSQHEWVQDKGDPQGVIQIAKYDELENLSPSDLNSVSETNGSQLFESKEEKSVIALPSKEPKDLSLRYAIDGEDLAHLYAIQAKVDAEEDEQVFDLTDSEGDSEFGSNANKNSFVSLRLDLHLPIPPRPSSKLVQDSLPTAPLGWRWRPLKPGDSTSESELECGSFSQSNSKMLCSQPWKVRNYGSRAKLPVMSDPDLPTLHDFWTETESDNTDTVRQSSHKNEE